MSKNAKMMTNLILHSNIKKRSNKGIVRVTIRDFDAPIKRVKILFLYSPDISVFFAFRPLGV